MGLDEPQRGVRPHAGERVGVSGAPKVGLDALLHGSWCAPREVEGEDGQIHERERLLERSRG